MTYSKINFIVPLNTGDKILKLRSSNGSIAHMIRESTASTKVVTHSIHLKQSGEANTIILDFGNKQEAKDALILLRDALLQLGINLGVAKDGNIGSGWANNGNSDNTDCECNSCEPHRHPVLLSDIWSDSNLIPTIAPSIPTTIVDIITDLSLIHIAGTKKFSHNNFIDIIPPYFGNGISYGIIVKTQNDIIIPSNKYKIDIECGIITFNEFINTSTIIVNPGQPPKVTFYKYIGNKGININVKNSNDIKHESPITTTYNGQNIGISGLLEKPINEVNVFINGLKTKVGIDCNPTNFNTPNYDCVFVKPLTIVSSTTTSVTLTSTVNITVGNNVILIDNLGIVTCQSILSIIGNTITFSIPTINTYTQISLIKNNNTLDIGDELVWFGSYVGYELDPSFDISYMYLVNS